MSLVSSLKAAARIGLDAAAWRASHRKLLLAGAINRRSNVRAGYSDQDHLAAAADGLCRAQDASRDGGVAGRYALRSGWSSSYPETTGYIIPTFLRLAAVTGDARYHERARRCVEFLLGVQLDSGAFPGMEIAQNRTQPSIFNTAQIVCGLRAWHEATGEERALAAARRATEWMVGEQDADGAWRKHLYGKGTYTYMAHAGCWVAEMGAYLKESAWLDCATRHLEWVLTHQDSETGWFDKSGFSVSGHERVAVTHTIAYTIWGVLMMSRILDHQRGLAAARTAALQVARRLEVSRRLPGVLDARWRSQAGYACLTGNAQMATIWFELHRLRHDPALVSAGFKAIDLVKQAQPMTSASPGIRGGIMGSDPAWGGYISLALPNWAAKFYIDALLTKRELLATLSPPPPAAPAIAADTPTSLPAIRAAAAERPRVVLLAGPKSHKVEQMVKAWAGWGFKPDCVLIAEEREPPPSRRLWQLVERDGVGRAAWAPAGRRPLPARAGAEPRYVDPMEPVASYCRKAGIRCLEVGPLMLPLRSTPCGRSGPTWPSMPAPGFCERVSSMCRASGP